MDGSKLSIYLFITSTVCTNQAELFYQAAHELDTIIQHFPEDKVKHIRDKIHGLIRAGGIQPLPQVEKTNIQKSIAIVTGKNLPSDFKRFTTTTTSTTAKHNSNTDSLLATSPSSSLIMSPNNGVEVGSISGNVDGHSIASGYSTSASSSYSSIPPPPPSLHYKIDYDSTGIDNNIIETVKKNNHADGVSNNDGRSRSGSNSCENSRSSSSGGHGTMICRALYNNVAEEVDELNFKAGDLIELIEIDQSGWWKGRLLNDGSIGVFPSNYVEIVDS